MRSVLPPAAVAATIAVLAATGVVPIWPGLVHATGLPPFDLSFDVRVLVSRAPSWPVFALGLAAAIAVRAAVLAVLARAALGVPLSFRRAAGFYAVAAVPLTVGAALEFAGLAAVYAWYGYAGVAVVIASLVPAAVWLLSRAGRVTVRRALAVVLVYLGVVGVLGALARTTGRWAVLLVFVSAALGYGALRAATRRAFRVRSTAAPAALAVALILTPSAQSPSPQSTDMVLFVVPGVDTRSGYGAAYRVDTGALGFECDRVFYYSYRGAGAGAAEQGEATCPIAMHEPYESHDTQRRLDELVEAFVSQLDAIRTVHREAPIAVVTHSQGAWIAWAALAAGRVDGVSDLVMLAPSTRTPVAYPPSGADGAGIGAAAALRLLSAAGRALGFGSYDPDAPLAREMLARPDALESLFARPLPSHVSATVVAASFDALVAPEGWGAAGAEVAVVDATHTGITTSGAGLEATAAALSGFAPSRSSFLAAGLRWALDPYMTPPS